MLRTILLLALLVPALPAGPAQDLVARGNAAFTAKRYEEAVLLYQKAVALRPESVEAAYDLGTVLYRMGDFARALESFEQAARMGRRGRVAALARYNAGNSAFQHGLTLFYSDPRAARSLWEGAIDSFRDALRLDGSLRNAAHNTEVVRKWLRLLEQHLAQQQSQTAAAGPPVTGQGPGNSAQDILRQERSSRSSATAKGGIRAVDKDW